MSLLHRSLLLFSLAFAAFPAFALPTFYSTATANGDWQKWEVATNPPGPTGGPNIDGQYSSFPVNGPFVQAQPCNNRADWIANVATCSNGTGITEWTFFVFRQSFNVSAADALLGLTLSLTFQWAADDSGQGIWSQGSWIPKWSLNSTNESDLVAGVWPPPVTWPGPTYELGPTVTVSGFKEGVNTLYFFVEGNGITDGMSLMNAQFSVPEPSLPALVGIALLCAGWARRRAAAKR